MTGLISDLAEPGGRVVVLGTMHEDLGVRKMPDAAGMIDVEVRRNDPSHVLGTQARLTHLRTDLVVGRDVNTNHSPQHAKRAFEIEHRCVTDSGVDDDVSV